MSKLPLLLLTVFAAPMFVYAADLRSGEQVSVPSGETIRDDLYVGAGSVTVSARIEGDLFAGGGTVLINGPVTGDAVLGGGTVNMLSEVGDDVRIGGGNILIQGIINGDLVVGGGQVQFSGGEVRGDLVVGGGVVRIEAPVRGDVIIGGGDVFINAPVGGNVRANAERIRLGPRADIAGNFTYRSANEAVRESGAQIHGSADFIRRPDREKGFFAGVLTLGLLVKFLMLLLGAFIIGQFMPRYARDFLDLSFAGPWRNIGIGLIFFIVLPILSIILFVTVIGIPFGVLGILTFIAALIWSFFLSPLLIGSLARRWYTRDGIYSFGWATILAGAIIYIFLDLIPIIGGFIQFIFMLLALGAIFLMKRNIFYSIR